MDIGPDHRAVALMDTHFLVPAKVEASYGEGEGRLVDQLPLSWGDALVAVPEEALACQEVKGVPDSNDTVYEATTILKIKNDKKFEYLIV